MSSWTEIERAMKVEEEAKAAQERTKRFNKSMAESFRRAQEIAKEREFEQAEKVVDRATRLISSVLEEIRYSNPEIRKFPLSEILVSKISPRDENRSYYDPAAHRYLGIRTIKLKWGNKFEPTEEDKKWLSYYNKPWFFKRSKIGKPPEKIIIKDYYTSHEIEITDLYVHRSPMSHLYYKTQDVIDNVAIFYTEIGKSIQVDWQFHEFVDAVKGINYWCTPDLFPNNRTEGPGSDGHDSPGSAFT